MTLSRVGGPLAPLARRVAPPGPAGPSRQGDVESSLPEVFARRLAGHAGRIAVRMGIREICYAELDAASSRVAAWLCGVAGRRAGRVVILQDDRARQITSILGVLKAGHAFVPLDPAQPLARLVACVRDAEPCALLCESGSQTLAREIARELAAGPPGALPLLDVQTLPEGAAADPFRPPRAILPADVAYILYTSGSTGEPKGVVQSHRNVLHNVSKLTRSLSLVPEDRLTLLGNVVFAFSMSDLFGALLNGAALLPYDVRRQGVEGLAGWVAAEQITVWSSVPTLFRHSLAQQDGGMRFPSVRLLKLSGEPVQRRDVDCFRRHFPRECRFLNSLGATEFNTIRQFFLDRSTPLEDELVPVGYAVEGTDVLILDERGRPLPRGEEGEIAIRSEFLSPGYWRLPEQTACAFIPDPEGSSARVYRTGDLGRLREDDCLLHYGRRDGQVRIRGHRVETAAIEAALLACADVRAAAVVARQDQSGDAELVAWFTSHSKRGPRAAALRAELARSLPDYMLPSRSIHVASLPLLPSGKVDRRRLAQQPVPRASSRSARPDLRDPLERKLAAIWCAGLRLRAIGRDDDFFELGGHSLIAARIVARIQHELGTLLPLTLFRDAPTIARMAEHLRRGEALEGRVLVELQRGDGILPLVLVPGAGGDAFTLLELCRALGPDQPVLALQMPGLRPGEVPPSSVEALAELYLRHLRARQPRGPYALGGESFGGVVAFAMAQALQASGERVALLALLDTYSPGHPALRPGLGPRVWPRRLGRWLLPRGKREIHDLRAVSRGLREKLETVRFRAHRRRHGALVTPPFAWRYSYLRELCFDAQNRYQPGVHPGAVLLLRAERQPPADLYTSGDDLGWRRFVQGPLEVHDVPGVHGDAVRAPHVHRTARILRDALRDARRAASRRWPG